MSHELETFISSIGVAIIMGAFQELPKKQYKIFTFRILFMLVMAVIANLIIYKQII
jgi:hypothetical protein